MKKCLLLLALGLVIAAAVIIFWPKGQTTTPAGVAPASATQTAKAPKFAKNPQKLDDEQASFSPLAEDDPGGTLRLEGQVLDMKDLPVEGAIISINSKPPRTVRSERDGSFATDGLIGKRYRLIARWNQYVGGPVFHSLSEKSDPVIIRMRAGATVEVEVLSKGAQKPVSQAEVELRAQDQQTQITDTQGRARFVGVSGGYVLIRVQATGYAPAMQMIPVAETAASDVLTQVLLTRGTQVPGRALDEAGQPVASARVLAQSVAELVSLEDEDHDGAVSGADGRFQFQAVAPGTYRFIAYHPEYPTASSPSLQIQIDRPAPDVEIRFQAGASIAGRVVDSQGKVAAWARVRIAPQGDSALAKTGSGRLLRQATTDAQGGFGFKGLPQEAMMIMAETDEAASEVTKVDFQAMRKVEGMILRLHEQSSIAGEVVNGQGDPVPEVTVRAFPDFLSEGLAEHRMLRGMASRVTDGAGRFEIKGLSPGTYQLRASRSSGPLQVWAKGSQQKVQTGAKDVRLVLEGIGGIKGRVVFAGGGFPERFNVQLDFPPGMNVADPGGKFQFDEIEVGTYQLTVHGAGFVDKQVPNVEIKADAVTDLGDLTVTPGRSVSGRVMLEDGSPVPGAMVVVSQTLLSDGDKLVSNLGASMEQLMGTRKTLSDESGYFVIEGLGPEASFVIAEKEDQGRSLPQKIEPGRLDARYSLVLRGFGSLAGRVTVGQKPAPGIMVSANPASEAKQRIMVKAAEDGSYSMEKLSAGDYQVTAVAVGGLGLSSKSSGAQVTIRSGQKSQADIDIPVGAVSLKVHVAGKQGAAIDFAQVLLAKGNVFASTAKELNALLAGGQKDQMMAFWFPGKDIEFKQMMPGSYSACVVPLKGSLYDPVFLKKLQRNEDKIRVYCSVVLVAEEPMEQLYSVEVPAMDPLPEEPRND